MENKIESLSNEIDDVAVQTNLLAINATSDAKNFELFVMKVLQAS
jgi:methyl-accepting chemotaxis protein